MILGVVGKTGSGKSCFANYLKDKGFQIINLDYLGRRLPDIYPDILFKIKEQFGVESIVNNSINRKYLGSIVFSDKSNLDKLNKIFFPYFTQELKNIIKNDENVLLDGVIIFEANLVALLDKVIYIDSSKETSLTRLMKREENTSLEVLRNRINIQKKYEKLRFQCDFVITNNSSLEKFYLQIEKLLILLENN